MRAQYVQFAKNEGKFILQQTAKKTEKRYEIDRELLVAALIYQEFIRQFIESQDKRTGLIQLIEKITTTLPETTMTQAANDETKQETLLELQLRWDKELNNGKDEAFHHGNRRCYSNL